MIGRPDSRAPLVMVLVAVAFAGSLWNGAIGLMLPEVADARAPAVTARATPTPTPLRPPVVKIVHETCCTQAARFLGASWESTEPVTAAALTVEPAPPFECSATIGPTGLKGTLGCVGLLRGAVDHLARLSLTTAAGTFPIDHRFRTMGDRLQDVKWFTEFEDPTGEPLACAAASARIIGRYSSGRDPMTATQILALGQGFNRSRDPGLDPVAIAAVLERLDPSTDYHYYRFDTKEEATAAAVYWLLRSGRPVVAITLAGQHAPLVTGFAGAYGTYFDDTANKITGMVVMDPQRGDTRAETASRRPDKYRSPTFQTGHLLGMAEWNTDEWWFAYSYTSEITGVGNIDRSDGAYPLPHWARKFVIIVDDDDKEWPAEREGRVKFR